MTRIFLLLLLVLPISLSAQLDCGSTDPAANGSCKTYYSSGVLKEKGKFKKGQKHGKFITYYYDGSKKSEVKFKKGKEDGLYRSYYRNGKMEIQCFYLQGLMQGDYIEYHDNGAIRVQGEIIDSKRIGVWNYLDPNGRLIEAVDYDSMDTEQKKIDPNK